MLLHKDKIRIKWGSYSSARILLYAPLMPWATSDKPNTSITLFFLDIPKKPQHRRNCVHWGKKKKDMSPKVIELYMGINLFPRLFLTKVGERHVLFSQSREWSQLSHTLLFRGDLSTSGIFQTCMRLKLEWSLGKIQLFIKSNRKTKCHHLDIWYSAWQYTV